MKSIADFIKHRRAAKAALRPVHVTRTLFACFAAGTPDTEGWKERTEDFKGGRMFILGFPRPTRVVLVYRFRIVHSRRFYYDATTESYSLASPESRAFADNYRE